MSLTVTALACALVAAPVLAQDAQTGQPLRLVAPPLTPAPARETPAVPAKIGATDLGPLDPSWGDALPAGEAALPADLWQGTPRAVVRALLPLIGPSESPSLRALARRLLLSGAASPPGADPADGPSLILLRAQALARLGAFAGAKAVLDNFATDKRGEAAERLRIELAFAGNDLTDGCGRVAAGLALNRNVWWDQTNIACQLLVGAREKAALALDILHDSEAAPDPLFDMLAAAASGHVERLEKKAVLTPLRVLLWAANKRPLPAEVIASADAATLAAFAGSDDEPPQNRLAAAERAAALGAWPTERLAELYGKANFSDAERAAALTDNKAGDTASGRALLFAIAQKDEDASRRVQALIMFLAAAQRHELYFVAARMAAPIIVAIGPRDAAKSAAAPFVRALIAADRGKDVAPFLALPGATSEPLVVLVRAIDGARPGDRAMSEALATLALRPDNATPRQIGLFLMLASEQGVAPPAIELSAQMAPAHQATVPSAAVWLDLQRAQAAHRLGETVLTSIAIAQDGLRVTNEPILLQRVLAALRAVGLDPDASAVAREAAVAGGL